MTNPKPATPASDDLVEALRKCRDQFEFYVQAHLAKQPPDTDKAATNQEFVELCDEALSAPRPAGEEERVTNGQYEADDLGPTGDAARRIASYCEGKARLNVYRKAKAELAALSDRQAEGWQPIETAPRDGTEFQARIPGNGEDNVIAWQADAFLNSDEKTCGGWAFTRDQEPPDCWTDGICWEVNEDENASVQPTHWKPLTRSTDTGEGG